MERLDFCISFVSDAIPDPHANLFSPYLFDRVEHNGLNRLNKSFG